MQNTLAKLLNCKSNGIFLLDAPTGFGKTTIVLDIIRSFLQGEPGFSNIKRIFFVTNLKTNLPFKNLLDKLEDEQKKMCFLARATDEYVIDHLLKVNISDADIINSKEYKNLRNEVDAFNSLRENFEAETDEGKKNTLAKSIKILGGKISGDTEPTFRRFIKSKYFYNKSIKDKKDFIEKNEWFRLLYPICDIEKYKVVFLTTKRFILPIDTFKRLPFNLFNDEIAKDSVFFIDEFDSSKQIILDQIVEDGLKNKIDIIKLFLDLNFALQNLTVPKKLLNTTSYHKEKEVAAEDGGPHWYTTEEHFNYWRKVFQEKYDLYKFNYLIKSVDFGYDRAFLFDDGHYFNVIKDSSKKYIYAILDKNEDFLALKANMNIPTQLLINKLLKDIENCIDGFAQALFYISNNFRYYKNSNKKRYEVAYTQEEALYSVLDVLNLNEEEKQYLFEKIQNSDYSFNKPETDPDMRRGFNFTEIEDSNYHDIKSVIHSYNFHITPEDILVKLASKAFVVGISATAQVNTCIGNYDLTYLRKKLGNNYIEIEKDDENRIAQEFSSMLNETKGKYNIHVNIVDDIPVFSDREKCEILISKLFEGKYKDKYNEFLNQEKTNTYYYFIELKLAWIYADMKIKGYKSFIGFLNGFPKNKGDFDIERLSMLFEDIDTNYSGDSIRVEIIDSSNFDYKFESIYKDLDEGKSVYILTTYQTIGSGKNIQYEIPNSEKDKVVYCGTNTQNTKDFDAIYLLTPTNLLQTLSYKSENKHEDLARFLFQQEYLYQNKYLNFYEMKHNIANGFRKTFFQDQFPFYVKNGDLYANTLRLIIQAVGRICRCRNKNKNIYLYSDKEVIERIQIACLEKQPNLLNEEFKALLSKQLDKKQICTIEKYSLQSKKTYFSITKAAYQVRYSQNNVDQWKQLREFVLQYPTADYVLPKYSDYYFEFSDKYSGYSYRYGEKFSILDIKMDTRYLDMEQVSEQACDLPIILGVRKYLVDFFKEKKYATTFKKGRFIMNPSLFRQVYLGAIGEVVGREILQRETGCDLEELDDVSFYEFFDYKYNNIYFDFKHWNSFRVDKDKYSEKVKLKLSKIKGAKCFVINLIKRTNAKPMESVDDTIIQIPYLIDSDNGTINEEAINYIQEAMDLI